MSQHHHLPDRPKRLLTVEGISTDMSSIPTPLERFAFGVWANLCPAYCRPKKYFHFESISMGTYPKFASRRGNHSEALPTFQTRPLSDLLGLCACELTECTAFVRMKRRVRVSSEAQLRQSVAQGGNRKHKKRCNIVVLNVSYYRSSRRRT